MKIAVLGLGLMGSAVALRLKNRGFEVTGWNRSPEKAKALADQGLPIAGGCADAVAAAELVLLLLSDANAIVETLLGAGTEVVVGGRTVVQMGTIAPAESQDIARQVAASDGEYLEAPVLGSLPEARAGRLLVMAGGERPLFERCLPVLAALGQEPRLVGPVGKGAALKLAMNQLIAGLTTTFSLSLGLVRSAGIDVEQFMDLVRASALYAPTFDKKLDKYLSGEYGEANFPLEHLLKDVRLFRRAAEGVGLDTAIITGVEAACIRALGQGYGGQDYAALYEALAPR